MDSRHTTLAPAPGAVVQLICRCASATTHPNAMNCAGASSTSTDAVVLPVVLPAAVPVVLAAVESMMERTPVVAVYTA